MTAVEKITVPRLNKLINMIQKTLPFLIVLAVGTLGFDAPTFEEYVKQFNKTYASQEEYYFRMANYEANVEKMKTITSFEPGVNHLSDWSELEIKGLKNLNNDTLNDTFD